MHPVKAEEAIREAYEDYGVRTFSLDSMEELEKIMRATGDATDLTLCVRMRVSSEHSKLSLASKFGVAPDESKALLFAAFFTGLWLISAAFFRAASKADHKLATAR